MDIKLDYHDRHLEGAKNLTEILCLAALVSGEILDDQHTIYDAAAYYKRMEHGCSDCPMFAKCLACMTNE